MNNHKAFCFFLFCIFIFLNSANGMSDKFNLSAVDPIENPSKFDALAKKISDEFGYKSDLDSDLIRNRLCLNNAVEEKIVQGRKEFSDICAKIDKKEVLTKEEEGRINMATVAVINGQWEHVCRIDVGCLRSFGDDDDVVCQGLQAQFFCKIDTRMLLELVRKCQEADRPGRTDQQPQKILYRYFEYESDMNTTIGLLFGWLRPNNMPSASSLFHKKWLKEAEQKQKEYRRYISNQCELADKVEWHIVASGHTANEVSKTKDLRVGLANQLGKMDKASPIYSSLFSVRKQAQRLDGDNEIKPNETLVSQFWFVHSCHAVMGWVPVVQDHFNEIKTGSCQNDSESDDSLLLSEGERKFVDSGDDEFDEYDKFDEDDESDEDEEFDKHSFEELRKQIEELKVERPKKRSDRLSDFYLSLKNNEK